MSLQTVSNALNAPHLLRPQTLQRVLASVAELHYTPNQAARSLRTKAAGAIGCRLLPPERRGSGGVLDRFLYALSETAGASDYSLMCHACSTDDDEITIFDRLARQASVDGFVLTGTHTADPRPDWLLRHHVPFVSFGRPWNSRGDQHSWVDIDGAAGTDSATTHLLEQGHRRIAFLGWERANDVGEDRRAGWARAMKRKRLAIGGLTLSSPDNIAAAVPIARAMLEIEQAPTAFVCASDALAIGTIRALEELGLRAGPDVGVVGFDDSLGAELIHPGVSSLHQPLESAAAHVVRILLEALTDLAAVEHVLLKPTLVIRGSSQPQ